VSRRQTSIDAHALGVLASAEESTPRDWDRERLIKRHQEHVARIYAGITERAKEHREQVELLTDRLLAARGSERDLRRKVDYLMLALLFCVGAVLYFAVKDVACPALPWISKIVQ
jgi:hypothetical protein